MTYRLSNISLHLFDGEGASFVRRPFIGSAVGLALFALGGCVSGDSALNLGPSQQPQLQSGVQLGISGVENQNTVLAETSNGTGTGNSIIPRQSPRKPVLANTQTPETTNVLAVAETQPTSSPAETVIANATQNGTPTEVAAATSSSINTVEPGTEIGTTTETDPAAPQTVTPDNGQVVETAPQPAAKPKATGLFARLFQPQEPRAVKRSKRQAGFKSGREDGNTRIALAHSRAKKNSSLQSQRKRRVFSTARSLRERGNALPGVKSNSQLFGIDDSNNSTAQTRLAAAAGFGRLSPNGLRVQHDKVQVSCLKPGVLQLLKIVERRYGKKPIITSGYRSPKRNKRAGGAKNSQHIFCKAVDIQVEGVSKWDLAKYLRTIPGRGGVGTYCRTKSVHIDIGNKRDWHHPCRRSSKRKKRKV